MSEDIEDMGRHHVVEMVIRSFFLWQPPKNSSLAGTAPIANANGNWFTPI
jgi:hypothetical protein